MKYIKKLTNEHKYINFVIDGLNAHLHILFYYDKKVALKFFEKKFNIDIEIQKDEIADKVFDTANGISKGFQGFIDDENIFFIWVDDVNNIVTLAHELIHTSFSIVYHFKPENIENIKYDSDKEELIAMWHSYLMEAILAKV